MTNDAHADVCDCRDLHISQPAGAEVEDLVEPFHRSFSLGCERPALVGFPLSGVEVADLGAGEAVFPAKVNLVVGNGAVVGMGKCDGAVEGFAPRADLGGVVSGLGYALKPLSCGFLHGRSALAPHVVERSNLALRYLFAGLVGKFPAPKFGKGLFARLLPHGGCRHFGASFVAGLPSCQSLSAVAKVFEKFASICCYDGALKIKGVLLGKALVNKVNGATMLGFSVLPTRGSPAFVPGAHSGAFSDIENRPVTGAAMFINVEVARRFFHMADCKALQAEGQY